MGEKGGLGDFGPPDETSGDFDVLQVERSDEMGKDKTEQKDRGLVYDMFRSVEESRGQCSTDGDRGENRSDLFPRECRRIVTLRLS